MVPERRRSGEPHANPDSFVPRKGPHRIPASNGGGLTVPSIPAYGSARCLNCDKITSPVTFHGSYAPHFWCIWCNVLWVAEMDCLLRCTEPSHLRQCHGVQKIA